MSFILSPRGNEEDDNDDDNSHAINLLCVLDDCNLPWIRFTTLAISVMTEDQLEHIDSFYSIYTSLERIAVENVREFSQVATTRTRYIDRPSEKYVNVAGAIEYCAATNNRYALIVSQLVLDHFTNGISAKNCNRDKHVAAESGYNDSTAAVISATSSSSSSSILATILRGSSSPPLPPTLSSTTANTNTIAACPISKLVSSSSSSSRDFSLAIANRELYVLALIWDGKRRDCFRVIRQNKKYFEMRFAYIRKTPKDKIERFADTPSYRRSLNRVIIGSPFCVIDAASLWFLFKRAHPAVMFGLRFEHVTMLTFAVLSEQQLRARYRRLNTLMRLGYRNSEIDITTMVASSMKEECEDDDDCSGNGYIEGTSTTMTTTAPDEKQDNVDAFKIALSRYTERLFEELNFSDEEECIRRCLVRDIWHAHKLVCEFADTRISRKCDDAWANRYYAGRVFGCFPKMNEKI